MGERVRPKVFCDAGVTKQSFRDQVNIHKIMEKYHRTGLIANLNADVPMYGDFSNVPDYLSAMNVVAKARASFDRLPASLRDRFANDPARLLAFMEDANNKDEAIALGICNAPPKAEEPVKPPEGGAEAAK